jgi:hypothetical protein
VLHKSFIGEDGMTQQTPQPATNNQAVDPAPQPTEKPLKNKLKMERYKYILQQLQMLNDNSHKYLTLFQTLATFIVGGGTYLFVSWRSFHISPEVAKTSMQGLLGLLILMSLFIIVSLASGISSWFDYRKAELQMLDEEVGVGFRKAPRLRDWWRWYEMHMIFFIFLIVLFIVIFVETQIIPQI